ncbi:HPP family protein [Chitinibacteraceae bacterium HSL-7]
MTHLPRALIAGLGAMLAIAVLALLNDPNWPWLMAPFGASCTILFALPDSPLARVRNVIGGHLITAAVGLACAHWLGTGPLVLALAAGAGVALMVVTETTHPPAGANPLLILMMPAVPGWSFLLMPVLSGAMVLVAVAWLYRRALAAQAGVPRGTARNTT